MIPNSSISSLDAYVDTLFFPKAFLKKQLFFQIVPKNWQLFLGLRKNLLEFSLVCYFFEWLSCFIELPLISFPYQFIGLLLWRLSSPICFSAFFITVFLVLLEHSFFKATSISLCAALFKSSVPIFSQTLEKKPICILASNSPISV